MGGWRWPTCQGDPAFRSMLVHLVRRLSCMADIEASETMVLRAALTRPECWKLVTCKYRYRFTTLKLPSNRVLTSLMPCQEKRTEAFASKPLIKFPPFLELSNGRNGLTGPLHDQLRHFLAGLAKCLPPINQALKKSLRSLK